jgi:2,3-bisphosphoglycerate-dependent phosphoglycerate mutase
MTSDVSQTITLHLVRHGETAFNAERRFQTPDVPLSDNGRAQAAVVAEVLAENASGAALILASDYERTQETARIIAARLALPIVLEPALRERNFGIARGKLYSEIGEETQAIWREPRYRIENGESWADVFERIEGFFARIRQSPPAPEFICVSHGGAMSVALQYLAGQPIDDFKIEALENCAHRVVTL